MLTKKDRDIIVEVARRFNVACVVLFGSSLDDEQKARDIDIGVKGLEPRLFFKFYAELLKRLAKPVDLVDLSRNSLFNELVEETGVRIHG